MASVGLLDIPYLIRPIADSILNARAKKLRATADSQLFWKRAAQNENHAQAMGKFYAVLTDNSPAEWKGNATKLKEAAAKGARPEDCSLSIAVSGGGLRVVAFLSFLETLREHNIPLRAYAGTSAGSLATALDYFGMDYKTVWECLDAKMLKALLFSLGSNLGKGILSGDRVVSLFENLLPSKLATYENAPFLYTTSVLVNSWGSWAVERDPHGAGTVKPDEKTFSTFRPVVFSREFDPAMRVSQGVFSSMCLPVFKGLEFPNREFTAIKEDGTTHRVMSTRKGWTMDGGYMNNYPVDILMLAGKANVNPATHIIISVVGDPPDKVEIGQDTVQKLVYMAPDVNSTEELRRDRLRFADENVIWWTIGGKAAGVGLFDFEKIADMRQAGRESAEKLLRTIGIIQ